MKRSSRPWILLAFLILILSGTAFAQPLGDYGDAPDGTQAYSGVVGRFPTLYSSTSGMMGAHALTVGEEMIGTSVSAERDADDSADPDGIRNLVDSDSDDKVYVQIVAVSIPAPARLSFQIKIADDAPPGTRYINALLDFDKNGTWGGERNGKERVVKNQEINIAPGSTEWVSTDWFNWGSGAFMPTPVWGRLTITREPITGDWKGQGEFQYGEVQDFLVQLSDSPPPQNVSRNATNITKKPGCGNNRRDAGEQCDGTDDAACPGKCQPNCKCLKGGGGGPNGEPIDPPGPKKGPCTTPVEYHALVINAGDNAQRKQGMAAADDIFSLIKEQGYDSAQYLAPNWDKAIGETPHVGGSGGGYSDLKSIEEAIKNLGKESKCVDRIMIYIVGHGLKPGGEKYGKTWSSGGIILNGEKGAKEVLTPEQLDAWISQYIPPCENQDCKTPETSCHVNIVIESCHSGNFLGPLSKQGRTVAVSCSASEVSFFGENSDGNTYGGDYSNGYVKDMRSPSTADTDKDGVVSVAEAHKSATDKLSLAKKNGATQTPGFFTDECPCLPLSCGPKCPNGVVEEGEECDPDADPDGCDDGAICNGDCVCIASIEGPDDGGLTGCPQDQYGQEECEAKKQTNQICVLNEQTDCYYLQNVCDHLEYVSETCDGNCGGDQDCLISNTDVPCYVCGTQDCADGEYESQDACNSDCKSACQYNEGSKCWDCGDLSCEDRGMFSSESDCGKECQLPDQCAFYSQYGCYYCKQYSCGTGFYEDSKCGNDCGEDKSCEPYGETGCYYCADIPCPDLYISYRQTQVSKGYSTHCETKGEVQTCETTCTLSATTSLTVKNAGNANAGASKTNVEITPDVGEKSLSASQLGPGKTDTLEFSFSQSDTVSGSGTEACGSLDWWASTYTTVATADYGDDVDECNEKNNVNSGQTTPK